MTTSMKIVVRLRPRYSDYSGMGRGKKGIVRVLVAGGILRLVLSPLGSFASHRPLTFRKVKNHFRDDDNGDILPSVGKINSNTIITTVSYENRVIIHCHYTRRNVQVSLAAFLSFVMVYFLILSLNRFVAFSNGSMSFILPLQ